MPCIRLYSVQAVVYRTKRRMNRRRVIIRSVHTPSQKRKEPIGSPGVPAPDTGIGRTRGRHVPLLPLRQAPPGRVRAVHSAEGRAGRPCDADGVQGRSSDHPFPGQGYRQQRFYRRLHVLKPRQVMDRILGSGGKEGFDFAPRDCYSEAKHSHLRIATE